jgi:N1-aminopropylagmatine ureohydrolase
MLSDKSEQIMDKKINFGGLAGDYAELERSKIVILPVPFEFTNKWIDGWISGTSKGPKALLEASQYIELYDIETNALVYQNVISTADPIIASSSTEVVEVVASAVKSFLDQEKFVVLLGGEHTVSLGAIRAHTRSTDDITVLQLDAHADLRNEFDGDPLSHACVMARTKDLAPIVQIGIRSMDSTEIQNMNKERVFFAKDIHNRYDWMDKAVSMTSKRVYVTIDVDVFDTGIMPSASTPEPGGLDWYMVTNFLKKLSEKREIVGFDVVELCPNPQNRAPDFLAAKLVYTFLSYIFAEKL